MFASKRIALAALLLLGIATPLRAQVTGTNLNGLTTVTSSAVTSTALVLINVGGLTPSDRVITAAEMAKAIQAQLTFSTGLSFTGSTMLNTGVTSLVSGDARLVLSGTNGALTGSVVITGGAGIGITGTSIANTGVLSLAADASGRLVLSNTNGALTVSSVLTASTGIGISGTTILNTGAQSLAIGGAGLSVSSATGAITLTNTGVISLTPGNAGIVLSGTNGALTVSNGGVLSVAIAGSGLNISDTFGAITFTNTGVTSLAISGTGGTLSGTNGTLTLTIGNFRAPLTTTATDTTSITPNSSTADIVYQNNTQASTTLTINADAGTPANGQKLILKVKSAATQTLAWNAQYTSGSGSLAVTLPATTTTGKIDYIGFIYDAVNSKWHCTSIAPGY